jgi:hypothetical protein
MATAFRTVNIFANSKDMAAAGSFLPPSFQAIKHFHDLADFQ